MKHSKTRGEHDEPTYNVRHDGIWSNILLLTWIYGSCTAAGSSSVSVLCKTPLGGRGFVIVTLSNLTTKTIPKGQTLFATSGNETIKFEVAVAISENGSGTYRTSAPAFQEEGDCTGWYN